MLIEGDEVNDPIADSARAILDGHIVLSKPLAEQGQYPAVDIEASVSRVFAAVTTPAQQAQAREFRQLYATYSKHEDLITVGAYTAGNDPMVDRAVDMHPALMRFLGQGMDERVDLSESARRLDALLRQPAEPEPARGGLVATV